MDGDETWATAAPVSSTWLLVERGLPMALFVALSALLILEEGGNSFG